MNHLRAQHGDDPPADRSRLFRPRLIESGALAWPNRFALSADALHRRLDASGDLVRTAA